MKAAVRNSIVFIAVAAAFFYLAGSWTWLAGWGFIIVFSLSNLSYLLVLRGLDLSAPQSSSSTVATSDKSMRPSAFTYLYFCVIVVGALDGGRYSWSEMHDGFWVLGAVMFVCAFVVVGWCSVINPYFNTENRIRPQAEHHRLVSSGPYRFVRHPGYLATITGYVFGTALMLDSWWAFVPGFAAAVRMVANAAEEDRVLQASLENYGAYAAKVPFRLFPGIW